MVYSFIYRIYLVLKFNKNTIIYFNNLKIIITKKMDKAKKRLLLK